MSNSHQKMTEERGTALIVVLGLLALISLMTISIVTFSQTSYQLSKITCDRAQASYWAEGAVARTIWLLRNDIATHPTRTLGNPEDEDGIERYLADGREHIIESEDGAVVKVSIYDAVSGIDIAGTNPARYLQRPQSYFEDNEELFETYKFFLNSLMDYADSNDFEHTNGGFEKEDYTAAGMAPLPRNYQLQFREEILWVPNFADFFSYDRYGRISEIRVIPPKGLRQLRGNDNFFAATQSQIQLKTGWDINQVKEVLNAKNSWLSEGTPLSESLAPDVYGKLKQSYSFRESGYYTFIVDASPGEGLAGRILTCTIQITRNISNYSDFRYYEWRFLR